MNVIRLEDIEYTQEDLEHMTIQEIIAYNIWKLEEEN